MDTHTLELLEFDKIRKELIDYCLSEEGAERVANQPFIFDAEELEEMHATVEELVQLFEREELPGFDFSPIREPMKVLPTEGTVIEGEDLYAAAQYFESALRLESYLSKGEEYEYERISALAEEIPDLSQAAKSIRKVLDPDGSVKESHPELKGLRKKLGQTRNELNRIAGSYVQDTPHYWQSQVPAQRDGRVVLALKSNYRGQVEGVVHYVSSKGATVFIEPPEMLQKNNEIAYVQYQIEEVVRKILRELTDILRSREDEIRRLIEAVSRIDSYYCRARYARVRHCRPAFSMSYGFVLRKARHPLLGKGAVPIDIETDEGVYGIIITGPNAGGKTVTLKTVGLFALMNQFGMHIPAEEGSAMSLFDGVFADIGDDQSIEGSVSTFSGHMQSLSRVREGATRNSLVLLDELGSGTDPREGAALGMAVLDELIERQCTVLVTSHHGLLKNYGYTTEGVENASMDFDDATLSPNYRVIVGIPGDSHALDIAARSGIGEDLLERAKGYLSNEGAEVSRMIRELERKQREFTERERALRERERELKEEIRKTDLEKLRLKQREHELHSHGYGELSKFLKESRRELENLVQRLQEGRDYQEGGTDRKGGVSKEDTREVKNFIRKIEEKSEEEEEKIEREEQRLVESGERQLDEGMERQLEEGMEVITGPGRQRGTLLRKAKKGQWVVEVGAMKITLSEKEISPAQTSRDKSKPGGGGSGRSFSDAGTNGTASVSFEREEGSSAEFTLDVRGKRLDDALDAVTKQLDEAVLAELREFYILHGKGEGILQQGVHNLLRGYPHVEHFDFTRPEEGGTGKTYVKLR